MSKGYSASLTTYPIPTMKHLNSPLIMSKMSGKFKKNKKTLTSE